MNVDQDARDMAKSALFKLESHEDVCAERWRNAQTATTDLKAAVNAFTRQMWAANGMVILTLLSLIAWLANHAFH